MWILSCISFVLLLAFYYRRSRTMSVLKRYGIPGPKPNLIFGNVLQMGNMSVVDYHKHLVETYGRVVGYYTGAQITILVADKELIKNIQATEFSLFTDRPEIDIRLKLFEKEHDGNLFVIKGKRWKNTRKLMTPSFSPVKLKAMTPLIEKSVNTFIDIIGKNAETGVEFDFYPLTERLAAEVIIKTAFGIENNIQINANNQFYEDAHEFYSSPINMKLYLLVNCFPCLYPLVCRLIRHNFFNRTCVVRMAKTVHDMIKLRKDNSNFRRNDILQALIDSTIDDTEKMQGNLNHLTEDEINANLLFLYLAGTDTTSITLSSVAHHLVNYPEFQETLRREVQELYENEGKLDYNTVTELQYLDFVIKETLRLYPPVITLVTRKSLQDYKYENMIIPKGSTIMVPTHALQHDPEYWPNPEIFDPMRFSPERKNEIIPFTFQSFGDGPRSCIGMRLALLEMKLLFAKLVLHFRLEKGPNTEIGKLTTTNSLATLPPKYGVNLKVSKI